MIKPTLRLLFAAAIATASTAQESSWSRFRGPNGSGVADGAGLPTEFGAEKNLAWRTELPPGHSSPALSEHHVFVTAAKGETLLTICLRRDTGAIEWQREAVRARVSKTDARNHAASPTPALDADTVVVFFEDAGLIAYSLAGEPRWHVPLGPFDNVYGMGASPIIVDDRVLLPCDQQNGSFLLAIDKRTGKQLWRVARPRATSGHCTPIVYRPKAGKPQLILPGSFLLDAYDVDTGERAWWVRGLSFEMKSVPVLHDGKIFINGYGSPLNQPGQQVSVPDFAATIAKHDADEDGKISKTEMPKSRASMFFEFVDLGGDGALDAGDWNYLRAALESQNGLLAITAGGKGDMTAESVRWSYRRSVPQLPSPLIYRGVLYVLQDQGGRLLTLDPDTGEVLTKGRLDDAIDNYYASPVAGDGKVYCASQSGLISVLRAGAELDVLAVNDLDDPCYATPAIAGGKIFVRTQNALWCFGED